jgi:hypothetical protein
MSDNKKQIRNSTAEFLIFTAQAGEESLEVRYEEETIWLTQKLIAQLEADLFLPKRLTSLSSVA